MASWPNLAHWPRFARWPSTLLARWPIVKLASSLKTPQWHLTKVYSRRIGNKNKKKNLQKQVKITLHRQSEPRRLDATISAGYDWSVARQSTSFPLRHWSLRNPTLQTGTLQTCFSACTVLSHGSIMLPPRQLRFFARLARWQ